ncbi:class D sortase [Paenibacillus pabuli]|uniref:class D sortase n=1 Tax=Paenibacillus pabuli TaxID=1472 RepID=UPI001FFFD9EE|nr:class D sortase [Paenibacillus pabuli]UPK43188.1 class D sortase [Paenibacillus pabuli]
MKFFFSTLVVLGILVLFLPLLQEKYFDWQQAKVMDELEQLQLGLTKINDSFEQARQNPALIDNESDDEEQEDYPHALGVITIDEIDVQLPILEDATESNMKVAATHLVETARIGTEGNAAIAAHRAHKKGRLFNRMGELEIGDWIKVTLADQTHIQYKVDQISVVEPTDLSVLEDPHLGQVLTLITCDPLVNPTHRLIIRAVQVTSEVVQRDLP